MLNVGDKAPTFKLKDGEGKTVNLADYKGKQVVLFFYPKDLTPGCSREAGGFEEDRRAIEAVNAVILGISSDDEASHQKFAARYGLQFPLLVDTDHEVAERYGVWQEKNLYGKKYWGIKRTTFLIDVDGTIAHIFTKVDTVRHSKDVLQVLEKRAQA